jgi:rsbT co-antagonist protein RsbR
MVTQLNGALSYISPSSTAVLGYDASDLMDGEPWKPWISHPDDAEAVQGAFSRALAGESGSAFEYRILTKDGETRWVSHSWSPVYSDGDLQSVVSVLRDATERRRTEETLRHSEEQLKDLVHKLRLSQKDLSTPVVQIWDGVLALPLIGLIDDHRAQQIMEVLLRRIVETQSELVILDVTGVASMNTQVANYLLQTVESVSLLGARCVLTGIQPEVAQTVIDLGMDIRKVVVKRDMQDGLKWALQSLNGTSKARAKSQPRGAPSP